MAIIIKSPIEELVDQRFGQIKAKRGEHFYLPDIGVDFTWGMDPIVTHKRKAIAALRAREWLAVNGPTDAPALPVSHEDMESYRNARGLAGLVGFYARSLSRQQFNLREHPSFDDFARGLMAIAVKRGLWSLEKDELLIRRFPPRPLEGMDEGGAYWDPPRKVAKGRRAA